MNVLDTPRHRSAPGPAWLAFVAILSWNGGLNDSSYYPADDMLTEQAELVRDLWQVSHPSLIGLLTTLTEHHPDRGVVKAARKASGWPSPPKRQGCATDGLMNGGVFIIGAANTLDLLHRAGSPAPRARDPRRPG